MAETKAGPIKNPFLKVMNPRTWQPPMKQIEDALAGNTEVDGPVTFVSKTKKE